MSVRWHMVVLAALLLMAGSSCREVGPNIFFDDIGETTDTVAIDTTQPKTVLLEVFTGAKCPNCPKGRQIADQLLATYAGRLVVVDIHQGPLSAPALAGDPDLRTEEGEELAEMLGPPPYWPCGAVDRQLFEITPGNFQRLVDRNLWTTFVTQQIDSPRYLLLGGSFQSNPTTRKLSGTVGVRPVRDLPGSLYLTIILTEDSIIAGQLDGTVVIADYVHNHVLRDVLTPVSGIPLPDTLRNGQTFYYSVKDYVIPVDWNTEHLYVTAFVSRSAGVYNVFQALKVPVASTP